MVLGVVFFILHRRHLDHEYNAAAGLQMADWRQTQVGRGVARIFGMVFDEECYFRLRRTLLTLLKPKKLTTKHLKKVEKRSR